MIKVKIDMTGWVMAAHGVPDSRLTVVEQIEDYINPTTGVHNARWLCKCNCSDNSFIEVVGTSLKNGNTKSCGCLRKEVISILTTERKHKTNNYDLSKEFGMGWTTNTNRIFYFDLDDYDKIKDYCWTEHILNSGFHKLEAFDMKTKKVVTMHDIIGCKFYDHIDRNQFNNRKSNLRKATQKENSRNRSKPNTNTSGIIGVNFSTKHQKWTARIGVDGKRIFLGYFANKDDAIRARLNAEIKYYKEFAPQKNLYKQYNINAKGEN